MRRSKATLIGLTALALVAASALLVAAAHGKPVLLDGNHEAEGHTPTATHEFTCLNGDHEPLEAECTGHGTEANTHRKHNEKLWADHIYTTPLGEITCETVEFSVKPDADGTSETAPTVPSYDKCKSGSNEVHVLEGDCQYKFYVEETVTTTNAPEGYEETEGKGSMTLTCEESAGITVIVTNFSGGTKCHIRIKPQATIAPIYFRAKTEGLTDITVEAHTATVIAHFIEGGFFGCGTIATEGHTQYVGNTTVVALDSEHKEIDSRFDDGIGHVTPEEWELT